MYIQTTTPLSIINYGALCREVLRVGHLMRSSLLIEVVASIFHPNDLHPIRP